MYYPAYYPTHYPTYYPTYYFMYLYILRQNVGFCHILRNVR